MKTLASVALALTLTGCATDPRWDPALKEDRVVVFQACARSRDFFTSRSLAIYKVNVFGWGSGAEKETTQNLSDQPIYMGPLDHPKSYLGLVLSRRESEGFVFTASPDQHYPTTTWTPWQRAVAITNDPIGSRSKIYRGEKFPASPLPPSDDLLVRYKEMSYGAYSGLARALRDSAGKNDIPVCTFSSEGQREK